MKVLTFRKDLIKLILEGKKTVTRRRRRYKLKAGDVVAVKRSYFTKDVECYIRVTRVYFQKLKEMTDDDARKEGISDLNEFKKLWAEIYGYWDEEEEVEVIEFEVANMLDEMQQ